MNRRLQPARLVLRSIGEGGFTLIELLLALMIAVVVVVLLTSLFRTASRTVESQGERLAGAPAAMEALDRIREDLARAFIPPKDGDCAVTLKADPVNLAFCTLQPSATDTDPRWGTTFRVEFRTEQQASGGLRLVRIAHPLAGPEAGRAVTSAVIDSIDGFAAELYDGASWRKEWPPEGSSPVPLAARIEITAERFKGQPTWRTEVFIPAGVVVTSSLTRSRSP